MGLEVTRLGELFAAENVGTDQPSFEGSRLFKRRVVYRPF